MEEINILKKELGENLKFNEPLRKWTTFKIGGPAKYFFIAKSKEDLIKAIKLARKLKIPYFILGGGSNLLVSDRGFKGLVIKIKNKKLKIKNTTRLSAAIPAKGLGTNKKFKNIEAGAGMLLNQLVGESVKAGLTGLEWAIGIPGSVGGAIYQNAGAFGSDMSKIVRNVAVFQNGKIKKFSRKDCQFAYRQNIFQKNKAIILEVELELKKGRRSQSQELIKKYLQFRQQKQPRGFSAGSVFKNVAFNKLNSRTLKTYPQLQSFKKSGIIPAGWLIEKCGLKGKKVGGAKISEKHANFIINQGRAKTKDVLKLIYLIKKEVFKKFNIKLKEEIKFLGFGS